MLPKVSAGAWTCDETMVGPSMVGILCTQTRPIQTLSGQANRKAVASLWEASAGDLMSDVILMQPPCHFAWYMSNLSQVMLSKLPPPVCGSSPPRLYAFCCRPSHGRGKCPLWIRSTHWCGLARKNWIGRVGLWANGSVSSYCFALGCHLWRLTCWWSLVESLRYEHLEIDWDLSCPNRTSTRHACTYSYPVLFMILIGTLHTQVIRTSQGSLFLVPQNRAY